MKMHNDSIKFLLARMLAAFVCTLVTGIPLWLYFGVIGAIPSYMWFPSFYLLWVILFLLSGDARRRSG